MARAIAQFHTVYIAATDIRTTATIMTIITTTTGPVVRTGPVLEQAFDPGRGQALPGLDYRGEAWVVPPELFEVAVDASAKISPD